MINGVDARIRFEKDGKDYYMKMVDDSVTQLTIDGEKVPAENMARHKQLIDSMKAQLKTDWARAEKDRLQAVKDRAQAERDREQAGRDRARAEVDRKHAAEDRAIVTSLLETAVKDGLITSTEATTRLELSDDGFWINGKKQTEAMHTKYKAAYLKKPGSRFSFSRNSGTTISL